MYSQLAYHVSIAHIDELNRAAHHRSRAGGGGLIPISRLRRSHRSRVERRAARRSSGRVLGHRQARQLLDPRV